MPTGRLNMRRIRDVLRLKLGKGLSERSIAASLGLSKGSVGSYTQRARHSGLTWPLPEGLDDDSLELLLFPAPPTAPGAEGLVPDWAEIDRELRRPGVTRMLLWEEYRAARPEGFAYTWFCTHYEAWKGRVAINDEDLPVRRWRSNWRRRGNGNYRALLSSIKQGLQFFLARGLALDIDGIGRGPVPKHTAAQ
jgi:hypothetical protein